jgi:hypothetical protein
LPQPWPSVEKCSKVRVMLFRIEKVSKKHLNTEASAFSNQMLEGQGDAILKRKTLKERLNIEASTFDSQALEGVGATFS